MDTNRPEKAFGRSYVKLLWQRIVWIQSNSAGSYTEVICYRWPRLPIDSQGPLMQSFKNIIVNISDACNLRHKSSIRRNVPTCSSLVNFWENTTFFTHKYKRKHHKIQMQPRMLLQLPQCKLPSVSYISYSLFSLQLVYFILISFNIWVWTTYIQCTEVWGEVVSEAIWPSDIWQIDGLQ